MEELKYIWSNSDGYKTNDTADVLIDRVYDLKIKLNSENDKDKIQSIEKEIKLLTEVLKLCKE